MGFAHEGTEVWYPDLGTPRTQSCALHTEDQKCSDSILLISGSVSDHLVYMGKSTECIASGQAGPNPAVWSNNSPSVGVTAPLAGSHPTTPVKKSISSKNRKLRSRFQALESTI